MPLHERVEEIHRGLGRGQLHPEHSYHNSASAVSIKEDVKLES